MGKYREMSQRKKVRLQMCCAMQPASWKTTIMAITKKIIEICISLVITKEKEILH